MTTKDKKRPFAQDFSGGSQTDQSWAPLCDVNRIVKHYAGEHDGLSVHQMPKPEDFGNMPETSYADAMRYAAAVNSAFAELPSSERETHGNDPQRWIEYAATLEDQDGLEAVTEPLEDSEPSPPAEPAPQDSSEDRPGE